MDFVASIGTSIGRHRRLLLDTPRLDCRFPDGCCSESHDRQSSTRPILQGQRVFDEIVRTAQRGVKITIVQNVASRSFPQRDSTELATRGLATVRSLNMTKLVGSGVLHTKFIVVDSRAIYVSRRRHLDADDAM